MFLLSSSCLSLHYLFITLVKYLLFFVLILSKAAKLYFQVCAQPNWLNNNTYYFTLSFLLTCSPACIQVLGKPAEKLQYEDPSGKLMMLPSDIVLLEDPDFKKYVDIYAADNKKFFSDFAAAFQKLEELGCDNLYDYKF